MVVKDYDDAKHFSVFERPVASLLDLAELLFKIETESRYLIIRAAPLPGIDRKNAT